LTNTEDEEIPARFCIPVTLVEGEAIITNLLDRSGEETIDPREAAVAVAQLMSGEEVGRWVTFAVDPDDFERVKVH
jgi:hypothetical protein